MINKKTSPVKDWSGCWLLVIDEVFSPQRALVETLRSELLDLKQNCCCGRGEEESRKRPRQDAGTEDTGRGAEKRGRRSNLRRRS